jgi:hypothetical protein
LIGERVAPLLLFTKLKVTVCPAAAVPSDFLTVAVMIHDSPALGCVFVAVTSIWKPVPVPAVRVITTAAAVPVTLARTTSCALAVGLVAPAV